MIQILSENKPYIICCTIYQNILTDIYGNCIEIIVNTKRIFGCTYLLFFRIYFVL